MHWTTVIVVAVATTVVGVIVAPDGTGTMPASADRPVSVLGKGPDGHVGPCGRIDASDWDRVRGGCRVKVGGDGVDMLVETMVGGFLFSSCYVGYDLRITGDGRTTITDVVVGGESPCNDVRQCVTDADEIPPLRGRLYADGAGRIRHHVDMCLDTCMGRFRGDYDVALRRGERGWRVEAARAPIGMSGWYVHGALDIASRALEIEPTPR